MDLFKTIIKTKNKEIIMTTNQTSKLNELLIKHLANKELLEELAKKEKEIKDEITALLSSDEEIDVDISESYKEVFDVDDDKYSITLSKAPRFTFNTKAFVKAKATIKKYSKYITTITTVEKKNEKALKKDYFNDYKKFSKATKVSVLKITKLKA